MVQGSGGAFRRRERVSSIGQKLVIQITCQPRLFSLRDVLPSSKTNDTGRPNPNEHEYNLKIAKGHYKMKRPQLKHLATALASLKGLFTLFGKHPAKTVSYPALGPRILYDRSKKNSRLNRVSSAHRVVRLCTTESAIVGGPENGGKRESMALGQNF